jgi:small subunit ribosomal protein S4
MDLFGNGGESLQRRLNQPPGQHGRDQRYRRRESPYQQQLKEKQKVKWMYGLREKQFRNLFRKAQKSQESQTGLALLQLLERRLDNVIYRMGLARTRPQARQMVSHGHVRVNGRRVNIPSYSVKPGDVVTLKQKAMKMPNVQDALDTRMPTPGWLDVDDAQATVLREPERDEMEAQINEQLIVEFYSR